jgi:hypothetical protein
MFQPELDQWGCNPTTFEPRIANSPWQSGGYFDQPFFLLIPQIQKGLHDSRSTMTHLQKVVQTLTAIHTFGFKTQVRGIWCGFSRAFL